MSDLGPLYHWSPRDRLELIQKQGLRPGQRNVSGPVFHADYMDPSDPNYADVVKAGEFRQDKLCFSLDVATAWSYSHGAWGSVGTFDLWQVWLEPTDEVHILPQWGSRVFEVRVANAIPRPRLHLVGERTVLAPAEVAAIGKIPRGYPKPLARDARRLIKAAASA